MGTLYYLLIFCKSVPKLMSEKLWITSLHAYWDGPYPIPTEEEMRLGGGDWPGPHSGWTIRAPSACGEVFGTALSPHVRVWECGF